MDLLAKGAAWLERTRARHAAQEVAYRRGSSSATVRATIGQTTFPVNGDDGLITRLQIRDYLVSVCELVLDGVPTEPAAGDQVVEYQAGAFPPAGLVYEVMAPAASEPAWRYSDPFRRTYRIHTKFVGPLTGT